ncbi:MAG: Flp pilus assembly complex ATPase component TadA [Chloroflexi bacterium]|nr:Flp pilus assembly complex ATPase component TadA [Chloroflexota bacterium]
MSLSQRVERAQRAAGQAAEPAPEGQPAAGGPPPPGGPAGTDSGVAGVPTPVAPRVPRAPAREALLAQIRGLVQVEVIGSFEALIQAEAGDVRATLASMIDRIVERHAFAVTRDERISLIEEVVHEVTGLGPLEPLLADPTITEVMVNGPKSVFIERGGRLQRVDVEFVNDEHVSRIIDRIIAPLGRRIDESSPRVDARLPDGSRVNAIIAPLSLVGPVITIRKFSATPFTVADLVRFGTASAEIFDFLRHCIWARLNVFVSGGTGSGKTTFLNVLSSFIPTDERIVTVEDAAELQLRQEHVVTLEARPANAEGTGEITIRDLLRNAMHMRPDRIIVGECRSAEALDMIQAMMTGHDGSLSTGHANTTQDMLRRLETMILMSGYELPLRAIREQISSAVDLIVHTARLKDGTRKIVNITEVYGMEDDEVLTQDIFAFEQTGVDENGKVLGELKPTGVRPTFMGIFKSAGLELPAGEFGIPPQDPSRPTPRGKARWSIGSSSAVDEPKRSPIGRGKAVKAGGMVYISAVGPVDPKTGDVVSVDIKEQTRQCMKNLKAKLEAEGTSLEKVVWANWSLRESTEFDVFNDEWVRWFPEDPPVGQGTLMPASQRRAGFRVSIGVIAEA